jgi:hypothetical protein
MRLVPRGIGGRVANDPGTLTGHRSLCSRARCFNRNRMFGERRLGTPARLMVLKSAKSGQPSIEATRPRATGSYCSAQQIGA